MRLDGPRPDSRPTTPPHAGRRQHRYPLLALRHVATAVAVTGLLSLTGTGCGSSGSGKAARPNTAPDVPETTAPSTTVDPAATEAAEKAEITRRYQEWYRLIRSLKETDNDWNDPRLAEYVTGDVLSWAQHELKERGFAGERSRVPPNSVAGLSVISIEIDGDSALVHSCEVNDIVLETADGVVLDDTVQTYKDITRWTKSGGTWKISKADKQEVIEGVHTCAE